MQRLYVIAFPEMAPKDALSVEALRAAHDAEGHAMLHAHFTFVFGCERISVEVAEGVVQCVAAAAGPIEFCLSRVVWSKHGDLHYVFLCPEHGAAEMLELHRKLHTGPLAACLDPSEQFTPHLTVCKTPSSAHARDVLETLTRCPLRVEGRVRALSLGLLADGEFKVIVRASLGPATPE